ncbi:MAG: MFS transporter [Leadbetterella sp.]|nr:MFS transporter [Leadbetterella sp.]
MSRLKIKLSEKIGYGFGDAASSMFWKLFGAYLMIFYTDVFGLAAGAVGTMFLITRVWDSVFDPVVGVIADRTSTRWGKFRPYLLFLCIPFGIIGVLTFTTPDLSYTGKLIYAYVTYSLMMMAYSAINVPYASLLGVISPHPEDRNVLSTYRMVLAYAGSFVVLLLFTPLVNYFSGNRREIVDIAKGWQLAVAVIAVMTTVLFYFCFALTRERVRPANVQANPLKEDLKDLARNRPWWILLGAGVAALIFNSIRDGATVYYFKYFVVEENLSTFRLMGSPMALSGLYLAIGQAANIVGVILAAPLSNRIGKKNTFMAAMLTATVLSVVFFWLSKENLVMIFTLQVVISICAGAIFPLFWSMYADCADYSEYTTGNRATGLVFSASSMSQKLGWALGTALTGWLLAYFGFQANQVQSETTLQGIRMFLSLLPAVGAFLSVIFIYFYPLDEKRVKTISEELNLRRENV